MKALFARPRNVLGVEQAVISMLAGHVFDAPAVIWRLRVFRLIYATKAAAMAPQALRGWWYRRRQARVGFDGDTLQAPAERLGADVPCLSAVRETVQ
jgi:hypothetical protein